MRILVSGGTINGRIVLIGLLLLLPVPIALSLVLEDTYNIVAAAVGVTGFFVIIWGFLKLSQKQLHYYEEETSFAWKLGAVLAFMAAVALCLISVSALVWHPEAEDLAFVAALLPIALLLYSVSRYANRHATVKKVIERFAPKRYACPNCGNKLDRLEKSCLQCGAVVWTVFEPKPGVYQMTKTKGGKRTIDTLEVSDASSGRAPHEAP